MQTSNSFEHEVDDQCGRDGIGEALQTLKYLA
jgi:hypothetical protein